MSEEEMFSSPSRNKKNKSLTVNSNQAQLADPQQNEYDRLEDMVSTLEITASIWIICGEEKEIA